MALFVLIHGGLHGGWCWDHVVACLADAGHRSIAPDLPSMGADDSPRAAVSLAAMGDFIADLLRRQREPVVLVGHSMAGIAISEAAERAPHCLLGLVYVSALLVPGGMSVADMRRGEVRPPADGALLLPDGFSIMWDPAAARDVFYNRTDPAEIERAIPRLRPQSMVPMSERLTVTPSRFGRVPRAYVECMRDNACPIAVQRQMQLALPCDPVFAMASDHSPFLSAPAELAGHLVSAMQAFGWREHRPCSEELSSQPGA